MAKKSKARLEYERIRRNIKQQIRRAEKAGLGIYADLPLTPKQRGQKGLYKEYQKATTELKRLQKWLNESLQKERKTRKRLDLERAVSEQVIDNVLTDLNNFITGAQSNPEGAKYIYQKITELNTQQGSVKLAAALQSLNEQGIVITRAERYDIGSAVQYVYSLARELNRLGFMSDEDYEKFGELPEEDEIVTEEMYDDYMDVTNIVTEMPIVE